MNRTQFFNTVRKQLHQGKLNQEQVDGYEAILNELDCYNLSTQEKAYMLATAYHETKYTMQPVREAYWMSEAWRKKNLRYYPHYGRGYVQLTWPFNYERVDRELGLNGALVANLDLAMQPGIAAKIMIYGMREGWFTNKKLSDYIKNGKADYVGARRIINGTDDARLIAGYAEKFEMALT